MLQLILNMFFSVSRNVSSLSIAQAAPLLPETKQHAVIGGGDICPRCGKAVYFAEKVFGGGQVGFMNYIS